MDVLLLVYAQVERFGFPLAVLAWVVAWSAVLALGWHLRREVQLYRKAFLAILILSLTAHLLDICVTLLITPDLALEANPIWVVARRALGLPLAELYGFTGKILLSAMSAYAWVYYCSRRDSLQPHEAANLKEFMQRFGASSPRILGVRWAPILHLFAFLFAWIGPFFFYIVAFNIVGALNDDTRRHALLPSPLPTAATYLAAVTGAYFVLGYRALAPHQGRA